MNNSVDDLFNEVPTEEESICSKYCTKIKGGEYNPVPRRYNPFFSSGFGSLLIFGLLVITQHSDVPVIASSFAASTVLLSVCPHAPYSQPRNVIFGHTLGALVGCTIRSICINIPSKYIYEPAVSAISVGSTIYFTDILQIVHPPSAATAMVATLDAFQAGNDGFIYILKPIFLGSVILVICTCFISNISNSRSYPAYW